MWSLEWIKQKNEEWAKRELEQRNEESKNEPVKVIKIKSANKAKTFVYES